MTISEKVAYVKGLAEGLGVDKEEKTGKIISEMLAILSDVADKLDGVKDDCENLKQYVEEIDEDLEVLEDEVYGDGDCCCDDDCCDDDCCDDYEDDDCGCGCGCEDDDDCDCCDFEDEDNPFPLLSEMHLAIFLHDYVYKTRQNQSIQLIKWR